MCVYPRMTRFTFMCRNVRYHFWDKLWIQVISQHREEAVHMIQTGLCSRNALCMALVQLSWEGHGEVIPE